MNINIILSCDKITWNKLSKSDFFVNFPIISWRKRSEAADFSNLLAKRAIEGLFCGACGWRVLFLVDSVLFLKIFYHFSKLVILAMTIAVEWIIVVDLWAGKGPRKRKSRLGFWIPMWIKKKVVAYVLSSLLHPVISRKCLKLKKTQGYGKNLDMKVPTYTRHRYLLF